MAGLPLPAAILEPCRPSLGASAQGDGLCASGLRLPAPPRALNYEFAGHRMLHSSASGRRSLQLATVGAGCSAWHYNHNGDLADHPRWSCAGGSPFPSRPHLLWNCPHRWAPQCPVTPPVNTAEERLLAKAVPCLPPAPPAVDPQGLLEDVREAMKAALQLSGWMCVATDGASKDLVGAYSIVVQRPNDQHATGDASEDQSPYRMELMGICVALQAAVHAIDRLASRGAITCT